MVAEGFFPKAWNILSCVLGVELHDRGLPRKNFILYRSKCEKTTTELLLMKTPILAAVTLSLVSSAQSAIIFFDILGKDGSGLRATNEVSPTMGGTGGEVGAGIFFDDVSKVLTINIAWGGANGFTDLTGNATAGHLHGATASGGTASFAQNSGVLLGLDGLTGWNAAAANGGLTNGMLTLTVAQETALLAEKTYLNVHTSANQGGEMRGNLVIVPEPSHAILSLLGLAAFGARRKR